MNKRTNKKFIKKLLYKCLIGAFIHFLFFILLNMRVKGKVWYYHLAINDVKDGCIWDIVIITK